MNIPSCNFDDCWNHNHCCIPGDKTCNKLICLNGPAQGPCPNNPGAQTGPPNIAIGASADASGNIAQSNMQAGINLYGADTFLQPGTGGIIPQRTPGTKPISRDLQKRRF